MSRERLVTALQGVGRGAKRSPRREARLALLRLAGRVRRPPPLPARLPRRILIVRPDQVGDLVMAGPALSQLRRAFPGSRLTAWVNPAAGSLWDVHPALDALFTCRFPGLGRAPTGQLLAPYRLAVSEATRLAHQYDLAINLRFDFWWGAMAACWAGVPVAGYDLPECRPFLSLGVAYQPARHEVEQNLNLVAAVAQALHGQAAGSPDCSEGGPAYGVPIVEPHGGVPAGAIAIHPGAGAAVKLWTEEGWAQVADALAAEGPILLTPGSAEEVAMAERIRGRMSQPASVVVALPLAELAGLYQRCRLVLGPDNGPLHLAEAVGTPTVVLFGPVDPAKF
ncbi:MAG TPA: glycosyltransferase family 9 protein, partial [Chloroflexota bacterium]|nr:glycosyltransferase family 9 protein [Chloroflexota bacterium]